MPRSAAKIDLDARTRRELEAIAVDLATPRLKLRSQIVLAAATGATNLEIAGKLGVPALQVGRWRNAFAAKGLDGLQDAPRSGRPKKYGEQDLQRLRTRVLDDPDAAASRWSVRGLAADLEMPRSTVYALLSGESFLPRAVRDAARRAPGPQAAKLVEIAGIYRSDTLQLLAIRTGGAASAPRESVVGPVSAVHFLDRLAERAGAGELHLLVDRRLPKVSEHWQVHELAAEGAWIGSADLLVKLVAKPELRLLLYRSGVVSWLNQK